MGWSRTRPVRVVVVAAAVLCLSCLVACQPIVLKLTVNSTVDANDSHPGDGVCRTAAQVCTLRAAIEEANATKGLVEITLQPGATYLLNIDGPGEDASSTGDLDITNSVIINGQGATIEQYVADDRILQIGPNGTTQPAVTLNDLHLNGGSAPDGGAIRLDGGSLTVNRSFVEYGTATDEGAGIYQSPTAGPLVVNNSTFFADNATNGGGAITTGASAAINASQIYSATGSSGSAVHQTGGNLDLALDSINQNAATAAGGATIVSDPGSTLTLVNSTVADNTGSGPVISSSGTTTIRQATIHNPASGAAIAPLAGTVSLGGSIVSGGPACSAPISSIGYNLVSDTTCGVSAVGDQPGVVPDLDPLGNHGGPTPTVPPVSSQGIDAIPVGTPGLCEGSALVDQRLVARPIGSACDIGAVEVDLTPRAFTVDDPGDAHDASPGDGRCYTGAGVCTLRAAVEEADAVPSTDVITIAPGIDPVLTIAQGLVLSEPTTIHGGGATVHATDLAGVTVKAGGTTTIDHLDLEGGSPTSAPPGFGSGLRLTGPGHVDVSDSTINGFESDVGGGIDQEGGSLTLERSTVSNNLVVGTFAVHCFGGCIGWGGGLYLGGGTATVTDSTFSGNATFTEFNPLGGTSPGSGPPSTRTLGRSRSPTSRRWATGQPSIPSMARPAA